jgi:hypothetical protein
MLSQVLAHQCNIGYETQRNMILETFNGVAVKSLRQLKQSLDQASGNTLVFEFRGGAVVVLNRAAALGAQVQVATPFLVAAFSSSSSFISTLLPFFSSKVVQGALHPSGSL